MATNEQQVEGDPMANAAAHALMSDLGIDRREHIVTVESRRYREAHGQALERLRAANQHGTPEYEVAQRHKEAIHAWSTLYKQEDHSGEIRDDYPEATGQTHRLRVRQELDGMQPDLLHRRKDGGQGGRGRALGRPSYVKEMPILVGPKGVAPGLPVSPKKQKSADVPLPKPISKANFSHAMGENSDVWPEVNYPPTKASHQPRVAKAAPTRAHPKPSAGVQPERPPSTRGFGFTGVLATGDDWMTDAQNVFGLSKAKDTPKPNTASHVDAPKPEKGRLDISSHVESHDQAQTSQLHEPSNNLPRLGPYRVEPADPVQAPAKPASPAPPLPHVESPKTKETGIRPTESKTSSVVLARRGPSLPRPVDTHDASFPPPHDVHQIVPIDKLPVVPPTCRNALPVKELSESNGGTSNVGQSELPSTEGGDRPFTESRQGDQTNTLEIKQAEARKTQLKRGLYGLQNLLEIDPSNPMIPNMVAIVQSQLENVQKRLNALACAELAPPPPPPPPSIVKAVFQEPKSSSKEEGQDVSVRAPQQPDMVPVTTAGVLTNKIEFVEKPTLRQLGITGDLADSIHSRLGHRFALELEPIPNQPRVGPHNLPGRNPALLKGRAKVKSAVDIETVAKEQISTPGVQPLVQVNDQPVAPAECFDQIQTEPKPSPSIDIPDSVEAAQSKSTDAASKCERPQPLQSGFVPPHLRHTGALDPKEPSVSTSKTVRDTATALKTSTKVTHVEGATVPASTQTSQPSKPRVKFPDIDKILIVKDCDSMSGLFDLFKGLHIVKAEALSEHIYSIQFQSRAHAEDAHAQLMVDSKKITRWPSVTWYNATGGLPKEPLPAVTSKGLGGEWLVRGLEDITELLKTLPRQLDRSIACIQTPLPTTWMVRFKLPNFAALALTTIPEHWRQVPIDASGRQIGPPRVAMVGQARYSRQIQPEHTATRLAPGRETKIRLENVKPNVGLGKRPSRDVEGLGSSPPRKEAKSEALNIDSSLANKATDNLPEITNSLVQAQNVVPVEKHQLEGSQKGAPAVVENCQAAPRSEENVVPKAAPKEPSPEELRIQKLEQELRELKAAVLGVTEAEARAWVAPIPTTAPLSTEPTHPSTGHAARPGKVEPLNHQGRPTASGILGGRSMWAPHTPEHRDPSAASPTRSRSQKGQHKVHSPEWNRLFAKYQNPIKYELPEWLAAQTQKRGSAMDPGEAARKQYGES